MIIDRVVIKGKQILKRFLTDSVLQIEPTRRCNFHCLHCNHRQNDGYLSLTTYGTLLDKHAGCKVVKLQGLGEPLLHPQIQELVDIAKQRGHKVMIFTNGSCGYLRNVDDYVFSLETVDPEKYLALGKHGLRKVLDNIRYAAGQQKIYINCVQCSTTTPADIAEVQKFGKEIGASVLLTPQEVWFDALHEEHDAQAADTRRAWQIHGVRPDYRKYRACTWGISEFYYDYTGAPHPCCIRMTDEYKNAKPCREICGSCPL